MKTWRKQAKTPSLTVVDLVDGDALSWVRDEHAVQQVLAVLGDLDVGGYAVVDVEDALQDVERGGERHS